MKYIYRNNILTKVILISFLSFQPTISYSKEPKSGNIFSKLFSSLSFKNQEANKKQILKSDIDSLNINSLVDFEFSIRDILKNYIDEKNIKKLINNITRKDDKNVDANTIDEFNNLLPKSSSDKLNGQALIRIAKKLGKDEKTKFEIKKNIIIKIISSFGITVTYNDEVKKKDVVEIKKEDDTDIKEASSSSWSGLMALAPLGALGGGGGGSSSGGGGSSSSLCSSPSETSGSTFLENVTSCSEDSSLTTTWSSRQEYKNVSQYLSTSTINPYTLIGVDHAYGRGLSGNGKKIAVLDTDFHAGNRSQFHSDFDGKTMTQYGSVSSGNTTDGWHGVHVMGIAGGGYNGNIYSRIPDTTERTYAGGSYPLLDYSIMGVAYNADFVYADFANTYNGSIVQYEANFVDYITSQGAISMNNSFGMGTCNTGSGCTYTIDRFTTYQTNNGTSDSATLAAQDNLGVTSASNWADYISKLDTYQNTGVVVFASGNDKNSTEVNVRAGLPVLATELADAWLTVGNLDVSGNSMPSSTSDVTRYSNQCGLAREFCVYADGTDITSTIGSTDLHRDLYDVYDGSSMAAPQVTGAIALLSEAFPNHTPTQLVDRILATAYNDFFTATGTTSFINGITHGYNNEFGHGIVDLEKALGVINTSSMIPRSGGINHNININNARRYDLDSSRINLPAYFGDALQNSLNGEQAYFYDSLNGGFAFNLGSLINVETLQNNKINNLFKNNLVLNKSNNNKDINFITVTNSEDQIITDKFMSIIDLDKDISSFVGKKVNLQNIFSFSNRGEEVFVGVTNDSNMSIPYLNSSENGASIGIKDDNFRFGFFNGETEKFSVPTSGFVAEYTKEMESSNIGMFAGRIEEKNGFLESSLEGAIADSSKTNTNFLGMSSYGWINNNWSFNSIVSLGVSEFNLEGNGLLRDISDTISSSFAIEFSRLLNKHNRNSIHLSVSQPIRLEKGILEMDIPELYDSDGKLNYRTKQFRISPSGRQVDFSLGFKAKSIFDSDFILKFDLAKDEGHVSREGFSHSAMAYFELNF